MTAHSIEPSSIHAIVHFYGPCLAPLRLRSGSGHEISRSREMGGVLAWEQLCAHRTRFGYIPRIKACTSKGTFRVRPRRWSKCGSRVRSRKPLPGGFGHQSRRYYSQHRRCSPWTGIGEGG